MWRLLFSRFFLQLLRFLLMPAIALILGIFVMIVLFIITYIYIFANTIQMIPENSVFGIILLLVEILIFAGIIWGLYRSYHRLRKKFHNKLQEEYR